MLHSSSLKVKKEGLVVRRNPSDYVGLQLLIATPKEKPENVVIKPSVKSNRSVRTFSEFCYLKRCHLCKSMLRQDMDVYMYRGDVGFCSVECRSWQILMDERDEFEVSTNRMSASCRNCNNSGAGKTDTQILLEDLRRHRRNVPKLYI
ncbi:PREDICTED: uncharacterized protein LOC104822618 [Tarenaya hassleriana]|uniref:uncharacterized protein LOC104822618 n=1 Tax=Tarenaya hassleriana TaxID=28532 RepID=UPI00053C8E4F|nr:PREDICTED: uncharacterized protein LOC104822618 [Tarenaya hassleriana]